MYTKAMRRLKNSFANLEKGAIYMALSTFLVATFGLFAKIGMTVSTLTVVMLFRFLIPFLILLPYFLYSRSFLKKIPYKVALLQVIRSISVLVGQYSLFYYLTKAQLVNATMLWNTAPIFIPILSALAFGDRYPKLTWFSVLVGIIGVACVIKPTKNIFDPFALYGLVSGISVAISQVIYGHSRKSCTIDVHLLYFFGVPTLLSICTLLIYNGLIRRDAIAVFEPYFSQDWHIWMYVLVISISTIANQAVRGMAYKYAKPAMLAPIIYLSVLFSGIYDWYIYENVPGFLFIIGAILIILSSIFRGTPKKKSRPLP